MAGGDAGGRVVVRLYPGGVAGDDNDVVRKMRLGTLDAGLLSPAGLAEIDRSVYALVVPMVYQIRGGALRACCDGLTPKIAAAFEAKGSCCSPGRTVAGSTSSPRSRCARPADLKALKLFAWDGDPPAIEIWKAAGFNPVPLPSTEISTGAADRPGHRGAGLRRRPPCSRSSTSTPAT